MPAVKSPINSSQVLILQAMKKTHPRYMRVEEIADMVGFHPTISVLGPVMTEVLENHRDSLRYRGLVQVISEEQDDGSTKHLWKLTAKGLQFAKTLKARVRGYRVVPNTILDAVVIKHKPLRTYGFEHYTTDDLEEIRNDLPEEYHEVELEALRQEIINRRKQGAYAGPIVQWGQWYIDYREGQHFLDTAEDVINFWDGKCAINAHHPGEPEVYHRHSENTNKEWVFGNEAISDCIALCPDCFKRSAKTLARIPDTKPDFE